VDNKVRM